MRAALTGPAYRGHVFWDSDVFVLPFLAATHPEAARAMLEYRVRRLPAARELAALAGPAGRPVRLGVGRGRTRRDAEAARARHRSASSPSGPASSRSTSSATSPGRRRTTWTGPATQAFATGPGPRPAWSRPPATGRHACASTADGRAHIYGVIGPDEYHEPVDDNAFTNVHGALEPAAGGSRGRRRSRRSERRG